MLSLNDNRNWILTRTFNCDNHGDTEEEQISYDVSYYDGLGYALQNVQICANGDGQGDIIQPFVYDGLYREELQYLPYTLDANNGQSDDAALANQEEFINQIRLGDRSSRLCSYRIRTFCTESGITHT